RLKISVQGLPGAAVTLLADLSPGPTPALGQSLPLGFTPALLLAPLGVMPASGTLTTLVQLPTDLALDGLDVYLLAAVADAGQPSGYDFSNGASLHILRRNLDLAGRSAPGAPHFAHHQTYNQGSPI